MQKECILRFEESTFRVCASIDFWNYSRHQNDPSPAGFNFMRQQYHFYKACRVFMCADGFCGRHWDLLIVALSLYLTRCVICHPALSLYAIWASTDILDTRDSSRGASTWHEIVHPLTYNSVSLCCSSNSFREIEISHSPLSPPHTFSSNSPLSFVIWLVKIHTFLSNYFLFLNF